MYVCVVENVDEYTLSHTYIPVSFLKVSIVWRDWRTRRRWRRVAPSEPRAGIILVFVRPVCVCENVCVCVC
jgi:hypothetical protein